MKLPVFILVAVVASAAFFYGASRSADKMEVMNERLTFANEQLAAYKDRLQGATPDQAAKQIATLQARLEASEQKLQTLMPDVPRHLSQKEKDILVSRTDDLLKLGQQIMVFAWLVGDSTGYAYDFIKLFNDQKVPTFGINSSICDKNDRGILVGLKHPDNPSPQAIQFTEILRSAGLKVGHTRWNEQSGMPDFDLFICPE
jgi:hypothetical protein